MTRLAVWVAMSLSTLLAASIQDPKPSPAAPKATPAPTTPATTPTGSPKVSGTPAPTKPATTPSASPTPTPIDVEKLAKEPVPITGKVETWYQVLQGGDSTPVGTAHEIITRISQAKYSYLFECDFDYTPANQNTSEAPHVSMQVNGELSDTFEPLRLHVARNYGTDTFETEVVTGGEKRIVTMRTGETAAASQEFELTDSHLYFHPVTIYRLRQRGEINKPGKKQIRQPTGKGTDTEAVDFQILAPEARDYMERKNVVVLTARFPEKGGSPSEFVIDRYGRVLERRGFYGLSGVRIVATKDPASQGGALPVVRGRRPDPFAKTLTKGSGGATETSGPKATKDPDAEGPPPTPEPSAIPGKIEEAANLIRELRSYVADRQDADATKAYQDFLRLYEQLRPNVMNDATRVSTLDKLKGDAEEIYGGADKLLNQADQILASIEDFTNALDVEGIKKRIADMKKLKGKREFINEDVRLGRLIDKIQAADKKLSQATARLELSKKRIDLTGVVVSRAIVPESVKFSLGLAGVWIAADEPVQLRWTLSYAVINDEYYREGDIVKGEDVKVEKILIQAVQISYKDETREVPIRKERK